MIVDLVEKIGSGDPVEVEAIYGCIWIFAAIVLLLLGVWFCDWLDERKERENGNWQWIWDPEKHRWRREWRRK